MTSLLGAVRRHLGTRHAVIGLGIVYLISQIIIGRILEQIGGPEVFKLQVTGWNAEIYLDTFADWQSRGLMDFYHAHFIFDDIHWVWYALSLSALLAAVLNRAAKPESWNWLLALPFVAGLSDFLENSIQHVFLVGTDGATIIDPLPAISTLASLTKWGLALGLTILILVVFVSGRKKA